MELVTNLFDSFFTSNEKHFGYTINVNSYWMSFKDWQLRKIQNIIQRNWKWKKPDNTNILGIFMYM